MSFGTIHISKFVPLWVLLLAASQSGAMAGSPPHSEEPRHEWSVEQVLTALKEHREPSVQFEESTYSSLLTEPLITRGVLRFTPPSTLEKEVVEPYRERYLIEGDRITFESERKHVTKVLSLEDYPALRNFVEAFRASFTGDAASLRRMYETALNGDRRQWTLSLRPRGSVGTSIVDSIHFTGSDARIASITIHLPGGDRSVMTLSRGSAP